MIQRKQTIWLFLAALLAAGVLFFDLYYVTVSANRVETTQHLRVMDHFPTLLVALVMILLPFIAIFMFTNRKRQRMMTMVSILSVLSFLGIMMGRVDGMTKNIVGTGTGSYWIGAVLPVLSMVFLILAIFGINKDEKLVRSSYDRLR